MKRAGEVGLVSWMVLLCCMSSSCSATVEQVATSPDGKVAAEVLQGNSAGATDANSTYVELRERGSSTSDHVLEGMYYGARVTVSWIDSRTLLVQCDACGSDSVTRLQEEKWRDISIRFEMRGEK
jgi:hypothetical protein